MRKQDYKKHKKHVNHTASKPYLSWQEITKRGIVVWFVFAFCSLIINQANFSSFENGNDSTNTKLTFVLPGTPENRGLDPLLAQSHGAADQWDYLFEDEGTGSQTTNTQTSSQEDSLVDLLKQAGLASQDTTNNTTNNTKNVIEDNSNFIQDKDMSSVNTDELNQILTSGINNTGIIDIGQVGSDNGIIAGVDNGINNGTNNGVNDIAVVAKDCKSPRGEDVSNGDFVIAYQQRVDVNNLCNVQKRYCTNGILDGSYQQESCKENTKYEFIQPDPVSFNEKVKNDFIQPNKPSLSGASFDVHGKINTVDPTLIDKWPSGKDSGDPKIVDYVSETNINKNNCKTPWGEKVTNGQFVKAYKSSLGLLDMPCEVELRMCVNGNLKGNFANRTCMVKKMTYRDYLVQNLDSSDPTIADLVNAVDTQEQKDKMNTSSFWNRLQTMFNNK